MGSRRISREKALEMLYEIEIKKEWCLETVESIICTYWGNKSHEKDDEIKKFSKVLVNGVVAKVDEIDGSISNNVENWQIERIAKVDKNILRIALYELLFLEEIPWQVTINEAVDIAKKYGSTDSDRFINGVLDSVIQTRGEVRSKK